MHNLHLFELILHPFMVALHLTVVILHPFLVVICLLRAILCLFLVILCLFVVVLHLFVVVLHLFLAVLCLFVYISGHFASDFTSLSGLLTENKVLQIRSGKTSYGGLSMNAREVSEPMGLSGRDLFGSPYID